MPYKVLLTHDAVADLEELDVWLSTNDSPEKAEYVLDKIADVFERLSELPERGAYPKELSVLGIHDFREVFFKPYRIIYRVDRNTVYVYLVADGRRGNLAGKRHHRDAVHVRRGQRRRQIGRTGTAGRHAHADFSGGAGVAVGHMTGPLLVP